MSLTLHPFTRQTEPLLSDYLLQTGRPLSFYASMMPFLWGDHFSFYWSVDRDHFLLFAEYDGCFYMPLPPLGKGDLTLVESCFGWMDKNNPHPSISRIENIHEEEATFYQNHGWEVMPVTAEYLYRRQSLVDLIGNRYKTKRWACNHFQKTYAPTSRAYVSDDLVGAMALFDRWAKARQRRCSDPIYGQMLQDARGVHRRILTEGIRLGLLGRVVAVGESLIGYTFGFRLNRETFCVVAEITDLDYTGAASFLFRHFCATLSDVTWINVMDDSGLENVRQAKVSYRPEKMAVGYRLQHEPGTLSLTAI